MRMDQLEDRQRQGKRESKRGRDRRNSEETVAMLQLSVKAEGGNTGGEAKPQPQVSACDVKTHGEKGRAATHHPHHSDHRRTDRVVVHREITQTIASPTHSFPLPLLLHTHVT